MNAHNETNRPGRASGTVQNTNSKQNESKEFPRMLHEATYPVDGPRFLIMFDAEGILDRLTAEWGEREKAATTTRERDAAKAYGRAVRSFCKWLDDLPTPPSESRLTLLLEAAIKAHEDTLDDLTKFNDPGKRYARRATFDALELFITLLREELDANGVAL